MSFSRALLPLTVALSFLTGCTTKPPAQPAPTPIVAVAPAPKEESFDAPKGWKVIRGEGYAFAVPRALSELPKEKTPKFSAKNSDGSFLVAFDFQHVVTLHRQTVAIVSQLEEMEAEVKGIAQTEVAECDGTEILVTHGDSSFLVIAFIKDQIGYQFTCGTTDVDQRKAMMDSCSLISETFKFEK